MFLLPDFNIQIIFESASVDYFFSSCCILSAADMAHILDDGF